MNRVKKDNKVIDMSPSLRIFTGEIQKSVFSKTYFAMIMVMLCNMLLIGHGLTVIKYTQDSTKLAYDKNQQAYQDYKNKYELNNLMIMKLQAKVENNE